MQKELKLEENDFTGAVFEGKFYGPDEVKQLESLPSRADVYAKLLGQLQTPSRNLVNLLQVGGGCCCCCCCSVLCSAQGSCQTADRACELDLQALSFAVVSDSQESPPLACGLS